MKSLSKSGTDQAKILTFFALMILEELHGFKGRSACDKLMREFALMFLWVVVASIIIIDFLMGLLSIIWVSMCQ